MEDQSVINSQYYCGRPKAGGPIVVLTTSGYVVAEYYEHTGRASWKRVVVAAQKAGIEHWLSEHFPPTQDSAKAKAKSNQAVVARSPK